ncbi:MAG: YdcF family protein [Limnohabitans sp.]|nr:YdcF family protein [Limnohabitans sp.]
MFVLSKLMSAITQPMFWLALWWALALLLQQRWRRLAMTMLWGGLLVLGLLGFEAGPHALLRTLENRYPVPTAEAVGRHVGVIVLGGATEHSDIYQAHGQVPLGGAAERMTVPVGLLRQHPNLQLVFSGGEGRLLATGVSEAELAKAFYQQQGVDMGRVVLEGGSRTTRENAIQVAALLGERCKQPWLLVTSAWHMPRSVPEFEAVGCQVTPYPVDFRTGAATAWTEYSLARSLLLWQTALHEWLGLWVYGVTR